MTRRGKDTGDNDGISPDNQQFFDQRLGRRRFLENTGKVVAAATAAGALSTISKRPAFADAVPPFKGDLPYAPLTPATAAETASWFNPKTDAKWLKNPITVNVSSWWAPQPEIAGAELAFNKIFTPLTGITVNYDFIGTNYSAKVLTRTVAGNPYDVITINANYLPGYVDKGLLTPIEPYIKRDNYSLNDFFTFAIDEYTYKGNLWGLSNDVGGFLLYYNEDLLKKAGIQPPTGQWTWAELLAAAEKLTIRQGSKVVQWGIDVGDVTWENDLWTRMNGAALWNADGTSVNLDDPRIIAAYRFAYDLIYTHKVAPAPGNSTSSGFDPFAGGRTAMLIDGTWGIDYFRYKGVKTNWNIAPLPGGPSAGAQVKNPIFAAGWTIPKGVKDPDASWAVIKFYASQYFSNHLMGRVLSSLPSRKSELAHSSAYDLWPTARPQGYTQAFITKYMNAASTIPGDRIAFSNAVTASFAKIGLVWSGKTTPEALFPGLAKEINAELKQS